MGAQCSPDLKLMLMVSSYGGLASVAPARPNRRVVGAEVIMSQLLVIRADFGSVKQHTAVSSITDGRTVLYRSKSDDDETEISLL